MMDIDDCFFFGAKKWNNNDIRSQSHRKDVQRRIPCAPSIDNILLLDSVKTNDVLPTASQMIFNFSTQLSASQTENSQRITTTQTNTPRIHPLFFKPKQPENFTEPRKKHINKNRSNVPISTSQKKTFSIPYRGKHQIVFQDNNDLSQFQAKHSTFLDDKMFSADDDLFEDTNACSFQIEDSTPLHSQQNSNLKSVKEIPSKYRNIFPFEYFNPIQSKIIDDALYSDKSLVVCAPTGAGKTVIFELAIVRLLLLAEESTDRNFKAVYMAPIKALCSERCQDWQEKLEGLGIHCLELTGDSEVDDSSVFQTTNIIITTPEKWDSITRRWHCDNTLIQNLQLFMIDEVHTLNDSQRGATMEAVISRMKTINVASKWLSLNQNKIRNSVRFIAVSATIPNLTDIAEWLGEPNSPAISYNIDESQRPVKLKKIVLGYPCSDRTSDFQFDISLRYKLHGVITSYSEGKPTLVFCSTRKGVIQTADMLSKNAKFINSAEMRDILYQRAGLLKDSKLRDFLIRGVGCHHAGMDLQDRKYIANLFENGKLLVLLATTTLAMGVNLPAHLVVIMSTQHYVLGNHQEYSESQVLQMIGRAGRPQFDTSATAVIMTKMRMKQKYEILLDGKQLIESSLHKNLIEHLNAEIFLNTINDLSVAVEWIKHTFLYTRVRKNPAFYGISSQMTEEQLEKYLQDLCMRNLNNLASIDLIKMDEDNFDIKPLDLGKIMAKYCIAFDTMKRMSKVTGFEDLNELLNYLAGSSEFMDIQLRINEKKILNSLNKDKTKTTIRFPMKEKIKTKEMKINCLIQASLGCLQIQDFSLSQDVNKIFRSGQRITRCLLEILWMKDNYNGLLNAAYLYKCFRAKIWENSKYVTKQLDGIGQFLSNALVKSGITTFETFEQTDPREIEMITNRHPPFGNQLKNSVSGLPKYKLTVEQNPLSGKSYAEIEINLTISNCDQVRESSLLPDTHTCALIIANTDNHVIYKRKIIDRYLLKDNGFSKQLHVYKANNGEEIYINLISFDWVGIDIVASFKPMFQECETDRKKLNSSSNNNPMYSQDPVKLTQAPVASNTSCQHRCHNKKECAHQCCKVGFKNAQQKRKQVSQRSSVATNGQTPKARVSTGQNSLHSYIDGLKEKMKNLTDTPIVKRLKLQNTTQNVIDLKQFAFCPKPKISADAVIPDAASTPTITAVTPLVRPEPNDNKTTPNGWNKLDTYHKMREKFAYEPEVNSNKMEKSFNQYDNSFIQEDISGASPNEIYITESPIEEEPYGDFSLELPTLAQPFHKVDDQSSELAENMFYKSLHSFPRQRSPQSQQPHQYGQVVAWRSQDSPRHLFQKNSHSQQDLGRTTSETLSDIFQVEYSQGKNDMGFCTNAGIFCSEQELQNRNVQEEERTTNADTNSTIYSIFDGIF